MGHPTLGSAGLVIAVFEPSFHFRHQFVDRLAAMVARHARVQVPPLPFDLIVIRTIRRQKGQPDAMALFLRPSLHLFAAVNPEVVKHDVYDRRVGISL